MPGSISLIQMMIGSMLTALVVSREWERGTMEALLATPVGIVEFIIGKLVPNFVLGMCAMAVCVARVAVRVRHSVARLASGRSPASPPCSCSSRSSIGLLISTVARTQFLASQIAMLVAFLPGLYFSGFLFEVASMPAPLRAFAAIVPAYYYVPGLQTIFLAGDIWAVILPASLILLAHGDRRCSRSPREKRGSGWIDAMIWTRLSALIVKELLAAFRDPKARFALIMPPMIQVFLFAFAATLEVTNVPVGVLNQDWGAQSEQSISRFERASAFSEIRRYGSEAEARAAIDRQDVMVVVQIGQDFSRKIAAGETPSVQVLLDGRKSNSAQIVNSYLNTIISQFGDRHARPTTVSTPTARSSTAAGTIPIANIATPWCRS